MLQICFAKALDETTLYEPIEGVCNKCNCSSSNGTLEDGEHGKIFTLDCAMKEYQRLFTGWPEEMGDNSTGNLIYTFVVALIKVPTLSQT